MNLLAKIIWAMLQTLLTQKFVSKILCIGLWNLAALSDSKIDDKMVRAIAEGLGVKEEEYM